MWVKVGAQVRYHHPNDRDYHTFCGISLREEPIVAHCQRPTREECCTKCWKRVHPEAPRVKRSRKV